MRIEKKSIAGRSLLIPRPVGSADGLLQLLEQHGCNAICFPVIEFQHSEKQAQLDDALTHLHNCDIVVFVSVPAVDFTLSRLASLSQSFPRHVQVAVMGDKTALACQRHNVIVDFIPSVASGTPGLLARLQNESLAGKKVVIFRGQDGIDTLKQQLQARGALVDYVECYRRVMSDYPVEPILDSWRQSAIDAVLISSVSILHALISRIGVSNRHLLETTPVLAFSERIAVQCQEENIRHISVVECLDDESIVQSIQQAIA